MSKKDFLLQPLTATKPILSIGPPGSGKSHVMLNSLTYWFSYNGKDKGAYGMFDEYHLVLPCFYYEQSDSYKFLEEHAKTKHVIIYDAYSPIIVQQLIHRAEAKKRSKKRDYKRIFYAVDDCTIEGDSLMKSKEMVKFAVMCRHYDICTWFLMHVSKGVIPKKVRHQIKFIFLYDVPPQLLEDCFDEFVHDSDFKRFRFFEEYWFNEVMPLPHCCLYLDKERKMYSNQVNKWYS